jgi:hypothetical protein
MSVKRNADTFKKLKCALSEIHLVSSLDLKDSVNLDKYCCKLL